MCLWLTIRFVAASLVSTTAFPLLIAAQGHGQAQGGIVVQLKLAKTHLDEFRKTKDVESLQKTAAALESINLMDETDPAKRRSDRREALHLWFELLHRTDRSIDPRFDPEDRPVRNVVPPETGGVSYPSGIDPAAIKDQQTRKEYEKARHDNELKTERFAFQTKIRRLRERISSKAQHFVRTYYSTAAADRAEFSSVLNATVKDPERASKLRDELEPKPEQ